MRGRKPVQGFNYVTLEGSAVEVQQQGSEIDFMESDITVLSQQPGLGKTHSVIEFCKRNPDKKILYLTTRHQLIDEITPRIPRASHWHGFSYEDRSGPRGCPEFQNPKVRNLHDAGVGASLICHLMGCDQSTCAYREQFKQNEVVFAPVEYINTNYVFEEGGSFKFDVCFVDESILKTEELKIDLEAYNKAIEAVNEVNSIDYIMPYLESRDYRKLRELKPEIEESIKEALIKYGYSRDYTKLKTINKLKLDKILEYGYYEELYRGKLEECRTSGGLPIYYKPFSYKIFDIAQQAPVVMLDASFEETLFRDHLEFYNYEFGLEKELNVTIYRSEASNFGSFIYKMHDTSAHPKINFVDSKYKDNTMSWVREDLQQICDIFGSQNVGIITYKDLLIDNIVTGRKEFLGFEAMSYGSLLGSNSFDRKMVLVILGTFDIAPNQVIEEIYKHYLFCYPPDSLTDAKTLSEGHDPSSGDLKTGPWSLEGEDFTDGYRALWGTLDPPLDKLPYIISSAYGANEVYQALHRSRFLINNVAVFAYCHLPGKVLNEALIAPIEKLCKEGLFELIGDLNAKPRTDMVKLGSIAHEIDEGLTATEICRRYNLRDKSRYMTKELKAMKEILKHC